MAELEEALHREEDQALRALEENQALREALNKVRCFAEVRNGGGRCTRRAWHARNGVPVCTSHKRARTLDLGVRE